tara:strand:- start:190 stop:927 length:738 start_codon:yes stop_codon:yes gene_type:complete
MIYTRIEWIWTDEGLKETFVESCEYEGEFVMCGGDSGSDSGGGGGGGSNKKKKKTFNPSGNIYTQPTPDPPAPKPPPAPSEPSGGGWSGPEEPKIMASTSTQEPEKAGFGYSPETGFTYNTTKERSDAAGKAMQYATIHGTLKGTEWEDDQFMLNTTANLRTNDPDYIGSGSEGTGGGRTGKTGTGGTPTGDDEEEIVETEEPLSTFVDDEALRKTRRRLRDRFGRRATRGGGAETVGTGYTLGS